MSQKIVSLASIKIQSFIRKKNSSTNIGWEIVLPNVLMDVSPTQSLSTSTKNNICCVNQEGCVLHHLKNTVDIDKEKCN